MDECMDEKGWILFLNIGNKPYFYFTMTRGKLTPIFTPNTLESMIEYTLISSILDRYVKKNKTVGISKI
jgi:hypothetical protein